MDPYMVMRLGVIPGVNASGNNLRRGVQNAGQKVRNQLPFAYATADVPVNAPSPQISGFGSWRGAFGTFGGVDPYMVMRLGVIPGVHASGNNIRQGVQNSGRLVRSQFPFSYPDAI